MGFIRHGQGRVIIDGEDISKLPPTARVGGGSG